MWNTESDAEESFRKKVIWGSAAIVVVGILAAVWYYKYHAGVQPASVKNEAPPPAAPPPQTATEPAIHNPVPVPADTKPLPALKESDPEVRQALSGVWGTRSVSQFLVPENIVRHVVVTVDNLPRKKLNVDLRPLKPTPGATVVATQADITTLSEANFQRYTPLMKALGSTDMSVLANTYFRLYPLFQQAYEDLGFPGEYFNDRVVAVIDDMLKTPQIQGPIQVTQPKVFYEYADPKLETLSAGQKLLLRMGPANEALAKAKLREFRRAIVNRPEEPVTH